MRRRYHGLDSGSGSIMLRTDMADMLAICAETTTALPFLICLTAIWLENIVDLIERDVLWAY